MKMIKTIIFGIVAASAVFLVAAELTCKDQDGNPVDWFAVLKIPYQKELSEPLNTGFSYAYISGKPLKGKGGEDTSAWKLSKVLTTDKDSIFGRTLAPLHADPKKYTHIMYNDAPPHASGVKESGSRAHAKGVLAMDKDTGFWLIHSVPNFPQIPTQKYEWPNSGKLNGQSALCISFNTKQTGFNIVEQLKYMGINDYAFHVTKEIEGLVTNIHEPKNKRAKTPGEKKTVPIASIGETAFTSFARSKKGAGEGDLYEKFVAPTLKHNMFVETWRRGAGNPSPSSCQPQYKINNIEAIKIPFASGTTPADSGSWPYIKDHSKWGMSDSEDKPFVCIGDINRMASQDKRGGGTVCFSNPTVWKRYSEVVDGLEGCQNPNQGAHLKNFLKGKFHKG